LFISVTLATMAINTQMPMAGYLDARFFGMESYGEIAGINMAAISLIGGSSVLLIGILFE
jgi:hypothetical protein